MRRIRGLVFVLVAAAAAAAGRTAQSGPPGQAPAERRLVGLWRAKLDLGPEIEGPLVIERNGESWRAEIAGRSVPAEVRDGALSFTLPDGQGAFRGKLANGRILGHWIQPKTISGGGFPFATPVELERQRPGRWRGLVAPVSDAMTFYLPIRLADDGRLETFLRNPERNAGRFLPVEHVSLEGRNVKLLGRRSKDGPETVLAEGPFDAENETFSISIPIRGGTFDFRRATAAGEAGFYPRGKAPARYVLPAPAGRGRRLARGRSRGCRHLSRGHQPLRPDALRHAHRLVPRVRHPRRADRAARQAGARGVLSRLSPRGAPRHPVGGQDPRHVAYGRREPQRAADQRLDSRLRDDGRPRRRPPARSAQADDDRRAPADDGLRPGVRRFHSGLAGPRRPDERPDGAAGLAPLHAGSEERAGARREGRLLQRQSQPRRRRARESDRALAPRPLPGAPRRAAPDRAATA